MTALHRLEVAPPPARPAVRVGGVVRHGVMGAAMLPCLMGGSTSLQLVALFALVAVSVWASFRARRDPRELHELLDTEAMIALVLAGLLAHGDGSPGAHQHGASFGPTAGTVIAVAAVVAWIASRGADVRRVPLRCGTALTGGMIVFMAAIVLFSPG